MKDWRPWSSRLSERSSVQTRQTGPNLWHHDNPQLFVDEKYGVDLQKLTIKLVSNIIQVV